MDNESIIEISSDEDYMEECETKIDKTQVYINKFWCIFEKENNFVCHNQMVHWNFQYKSKSMIILVWVRQLQTIFWS